MVNKRNITFFDLGSHKGEEIDWFLKELQPFPEFSFKVWGFEAFPDSFKKLKEKYHSNPSVSITHTAVSDREGTAHLFICPSSSLGHSLFSDKRNVDPGQKVKVTTTRLSTFITKNIPPKSSSDIWMIKSNIEGAEYMVVPDLVHLNLLSSFDIIFGTWASDFRKIKSLSGKENTILSHLSKTNLIERIFTNDSKRKQIFSLKDFLSKL